MLFFRPKAERNPLSLFWTTAKTHERVEGVTTTNINQLPSGSEGKRITVRTITADYPGPSHVRLSIQSKWRAAH